MFAQLWYGGVEQFYCQANTCLQKVDDGTGTAIWDCQNLQCYCIPGTTFCGGGPLDITQTIDTLVTGAIKVTCAALDNTETATCNFAQTVLQSIFGDTGLSLHGCTFGECVRQGVIDTSAIPATSPGVKAKQLSGGVIAGLAVVGALLFSALLLLAFGLVNQRKARRGGPGHEQLEKSGRVNVEWADVGYIVPNIAGTEKWLGFSEKKDGTFNDKVVLDSLSGSVKAGQMMAILGPSGMFNIHQQEVFSLRNGRLCRCGKNDSRRNTGR